MESKTEPEPKTEVGPEPNTLLDSALLKIKLEERRGLLMLLRAKEEELKMLGWVPKQENVDKICNSR